MSAIVVPKVTCDLPVNPVAYDASWTHLHDLDLADPSFGEPGRIDVLLGIDICIDVMCQGRQVGPQGSPTALETEFGWVLGGKSSIAVASHHVVSRVISHHSSLRGDDLLRKFWEIEEIPMTKLAMTPDEQYVVQHFQEKHRRTKEGRFVVPLPKKIDAGKIGESRSQAVRRFLSTERALRYKGKFSVVNDVVKEYMDLGHAEVVPPEDQTKDVSQVFYMPIHIVYKDSSSTTKVRAVFDASVKSSNGVSLNDLLLVGPTVHPQLVDVLLRFRMHRIALTTDVSKMYRAIDLTESDRDYHRFVWRSNPNEELKDYRMTRITFGISASCFAANMAVRTNALEHSSQYPQASKVVTESFYVDDGLTGADDVESAILLRQQLQQLFELGGFTLRKWNSSESSVLETIPTDLRESDKVLSITETGPIFTKTLGIKWDTSIDSFKVTIGKPPVSDQVTKRSLSSDIARVYDVLGWFAPATITMKILLQRTWEAKVDWDDPVPESIRDVWRKWRTELDLLIDKGIPRCYFPKAVKIQNIELHGYCDASEEAYAGVVYLRAVCSNKSVHTTLVISRTKVAPIKRLSIPRLELGGAVLVAQLLRRTKEVLQIPLSDVYAWTDSTIVLNWLTGNPRRFKTYVGNRVSEIVDSIPPDRWSHVPSQENSADCASRGLSPAQLLQHDLWWDGPPWLKLDKACWPKYEITPSESTDEEKIVCTHVVTTPSQSVVSFNQFSNYSKLQRVTAWVLRFIYNCHNRAKEEVKDQTPKKKCLTSHEMASAECYLLRCIQTEVFRETLSQLSNGKPLSKSNKLTQFLPFADEDRLLRVGGRTRNSQLPYSSRHPIIIPGDHVLTKMIVWSEHLRLLHAGPTLVMSSLALRFLILNTRRVVRSTVRKCVTCRRLAGHPGTQLIGQLPSERVTPHHVFDGVGVDYAGPMLLKVGNVRKPTVVKAYVCVFVSMAVKAVHLKAVTDLTTGSFLATLRRFISRRGCPSLILSDNGTNFVGADREIQSLYQFLATQRTMETITDFCSSRKIVWKFIPERAPHFGGLWESTVKSMKHHLRRVAGNVKLTYEELSTILTQIEACLNSRPLVPANIVNGEGLDILTPGNFLIGRPLCALPDPASSFRPLSILRRWQLCQTVVRHFWQQWSSDYLTSINKACKWRNPNKNFQVGDIVAIKEDNLNPMEWPIAKVEEVHPGRDGLVRVVKVKTSRGIYRRPLVKLIMLVPSSE